MSARILVVEDDPDIQQLVTLKLRSAGHDVTPVSSGEEARDTLCAVGHDHFDLAVVDRMMPGMTGTDLVSLLRAEGSDLTVLMLTARSQKHDVEAGVAAGVDDYMTKPFSLRELAARVAALLARR